MKPKPTLTPWFPYHITPARPGVYRVRHAYPQMGTEPQRPDRGLYAYWTGSYWCPPCATPDIAKMLSRHLRNLAQALSWHGLTRNPDAQPAKPIKSRPIPTAWPWGENYGGSA